MDHSWQRFYGDSVVCNSTSGFQLVFVCMDYGSCIDSEREGCLYHNDHDALSVGKKLLLSETSIWGEPVDFIITITMSVHLGT